MPSLPPAVNGTYQNLSAFCRDYGDREYFCDEVRARVLAFLTATNNEAELRSAFEAAAEEFWRFEDDDDLQETLEHLVDETERLRELFRDAPEQADGACERARRSVLDMLQGVRQGAKTRVTPHEFILGHLRLTFFRPYGRLMAGWTSAVKLYNDDGKQGFDWGGSDARREIGSTLMNMEDWIERARSRLVEATDMRRGYACLALLGFCEQVGKAEWSDLFPGIAQKRRLFLSRRDGPQDREKLLPFTPHAATVLGSLADEVALALQDAGPCTRAQPDPELKGSTGSRRADEITLAEALNRYDIPKSTLYAAWRKEAGDTGYLKARKVDGNVVVQVDILRKWVTAYQERKEAKELIRMEHEDRLDEAHKRKKRGQIHP